MRPPSCSGSTLYVIGGYDARGAPTTTVVQPHGRQRRDARRRGRPRTRSRSPRPGPAPRAVAVSDGLVVMGGTDGTAPTRRPSGRASRTPPARSRRGPPSRRCSRRTWTASPCTSATSSSSSAAGTPPASPLPRSSRASSVAGPTRRPEPQRDQHGLAGERPDEPAGRADEHVRRSPSNGGIYVQGGTDGSGPTDRDVVGDPGRQRRHRRRGTTCRRAGPRPGDRGRRGVHRRVVRVHRRRADRRPGQRGGAARTYLAPQAPFFQAGPPRRDDPGAQAGRRDRPAARLPQRRHGGRTSTSSGCCSSAGRSPTRIGSARSGQRGRRRNAQGLSSPGLLRRTRAALRRRRPSRRPVAGPTDSARQLPLAGRDGAARDRQAHALPGGDAAGHASRRRPSPTASRYAVALTERLPVAQITRIGRSFGMSCRRTPSWDIGMNSEPSMRT